jgi:hypothetical protein
MGEGPQEPSSPARVLIEFSNGTKGIENFLTWLREPETTYHQPFGAAVNAFPVTPEDATAVPVQRTYILVPGHNVQERLDGGEQALADIPTDAPVVTSHTSPKHAAPALGLGGGEGGGAAPF